MVGLLIGARFKPLAVSTAKWMVSLLLCHRIRQRRSHLVARATGGTEASAERRQVAMPVELAAFAGRHEPRWDSPKECGFTGHTSVNNELMAAGGNMWHPTSGWTPKQHEAVY